MIIHVFFLKEITAISNCIISVKFTKVSFIIIIISIVILILITESLIKVSLILNCRNLLTTYYYKDEISKMLMRKSNFLCVVVLN